MLLYDRPYHDEADYKQMRSLVQSAYAVGGSPVYCTLGDLDWWRFSDPDPNVIQRAHLWFTLEHTLIAFAWPTDEQVDLVVHPQYAALNNDLLTWAEANHAAIERDTADRSPLRAWSYSPKTCPGRAIDPFTPPRVELYHAG